MSIDLCVLIPMTTKGLTLSNLNELPILKYFIPSFLRTLPNNVCYKILIGIDNDDPWISVIKRKFEDNKILHVVEIKGCKGKPAWIWNLLAFEAYKMYPNFILQVGDDVEILNDGWWECFTNILNNNCGIGVAGFYDKKMSWREQQGLPVIIENSFVHRKHFEIFDYYFPWSFPNWYCDDWLTAIYKPHCCYQSKNFLSINHVRDNRYEPITIPKGDLIDSVELGRETLNHYKARFFL